MWYQGENDVHHAPLYSKLFETLIFKWRKIWGQDIPFIFAQLAPFGEWLALDGRLFPEIRRQQERVSKTVPNCYMISTSDVGMYYDIHPKEKKTLGHRYFLQAMDKVYEKPCLSDAPVIDKGHIKDDRIILEFQNSGCGLKVQGNPDALFEVYQGESRVKPKDICLSENKAVLCFGQPITAPVKIEFAQSPYYEVNIFNSAGLPALPACMTLEVAHDFC